MFSFFSFFSTNVTWSFLYFYQLFLYQNFISRTYIHFVIYIFLIVRIEVGLSQCNRFKNNFYTFLHFTFLIYLSFFFFFQNYRLSTKGSWIKSANCVNCQLALFNFRNTVRTNQFIPWINYSLSNGMSNDSNYSSCRVDCQHTYRRSCRDQFLESSRRKKTLEFLEWTVFNTSICEWINIFCSW